MAVAVAAGAGVVAAGGATVATLALIGAGVAALAAAGAVVDGFAAATGVPAGAANFGRSPAVTSLSCMQASMPFGAVWQVVATGPTMMIATTTSVRTAAPMVTPKGRVGAVSASWSSGDVRRPRSVAASR